MNFTAENAVVFSNFSVTLGMKILLVGFHVTRGREIYLYARMGTSRSGLCIIRSDCCGV